MHDPRSFTGRVQQRFALFFGQVGAFDSPRFDHLPFTPWAKHEVTDLEAKDGLVALPVVERTDEGICLVRLTTQGRTVLPSNSEIADWAPVRLGARLP